MSPHGQRHRGGLDRSRTEGALRDHGSPGWPLDGCPGRRQAGAFTAADQAPAGGLPPGRAGWPGARQPGSGDFPAHPALDPGGSARPGQRQLCGLQRLPPDRDAGGRTRPRPLAFQHPPHSPGGRPPQPAKASLTPPSKLARALAPAWHAPPNRRQPA
jgi:hypothetical protein